MGAPRRRCSAPWMLFVVGALVLTHWCIASAMASCTFTVSNYCAHPIWPATLAGAGTPQLPTTGFRLDPGQSAQVPAPAGWSGRIWARTGCDFGGGGAAAATVCQTGDCGGRLECAGTGATPPATLFEVTLGKGGADDGDRDYYDVSLVDGYNLPVVAVPRAHDGGAGGCNATGCAADLNRLCPKELQVDGGGGVVACRSACEAFGQEQYCCSGAYATPATCRPTAYSAIFKSACPRAYSYAYDDGSSTFTCAAAAYTIAFCLPPTNNPGATPLAGGGENTTPPTTGNNGTRSAATPPPAGDNGAGSTYQPPPAGDDNGAGSTYQPPPAGDNSAGSTYQPPQAYGDNGGGAGGIYQQPWVLPSSPAASRRHSQLWPLLSAVPLLLL